MIAGTTILSLIELAHALQLLVKTELKGLLERSVLENINHRPVIEETANDVFYWELTVMIPVSALFIILFQS